MGNKVTETTPWSDCPLDIFSLGETDWAFKFYLPSFRRPFTEVGSVTVRCLPLCVNHPGFSCFGHFIRLAFGFPSLHPECRLFPSPLFAPSGEQLSFAFSQAVPFP